MKQQSKAAARDPQRLQTIVLKRLFLVLEQGYMPVLDLEPMHDGIVMGWAVETIDGFEYKLYGTKAQIEQIQKILQAADSQATWDAAPRDTDWYVLRTIDADDRLPTGSCLDLDDIEFKLRGVLGPKVERVRVIH